jgi:glycosyltransferase involved in cell wall biosynthesis
MARDQAGGPLTRPAAAEPDRAASWPPVTAIVATRARPDTLTRAVQSMVGQSYPGELECVVVFDQSAPAPVDVALPSGRQVRVMTNNRTPGAAGARNAGVAASDGALVAFCDDDDTWHPEKLRLQVERLQSTSASFVACGVRIHYRGRVIERPAPASVDLAQLVRRRYPELGVPTFVLRRDLLADIGLLDEQIPGSYGEDYDLLLRAARREPIAAVKQPLVEVFWHQQSYFAQRWQTIADGLGYMLVKHPELAADSRGRARIEGQAAFAQAALAHRSDACRARWRALRGNPLERRAYIALAVASGAVPAASVVRLANRRGRGI